MTDSTEQAVGDTSSLDLLRAVVDPTRLAVLGAASAGTVSVDSLAETLGVPRKQIAEAIGYLRNAGLLDDAAQLDRSVLRSIGRDIPSDTPEPPDMDASMWTPEEMLVLERFFDGDRLLSVPSTHAKRRVVLEKIVQSFEPGIRYAERDVNFTIQLIFSDYAAIRRYLIDEALLDRADGNYWRIGGRYSVDGNRDDASVPGPVPTAVDGVRLVPYSMDMVPSLVALANNPSITRYLSDGFPYPYTNDDGEDFITSVASADHVVAFGVQADGDFVGGVGGAAYTAERTGDYEIGWWIGEPYWGRGYATTAVSAYIDYLFSTTGAMRVSASVMHPNKRSKRVAEAAGLLYEGVAKGAYLKRGVRMDALLYGLTREDWAR